MFLHYMLSGSCVQGFFPVSETQFVLNRMDAKFYSKSEKCVSPDNMKTTTAFGTFETVFL